MSEYGQVCSCKAISSNCHVAGGGVCFNVGLKWKRCVWG